MLHAVDNRDQLTGQNVLSRGIVGTWVSTPIVASPLLEQVVDLTTGACVTDDAKRVTVHDVRLHDGVIEVRLRCADRPAATGA